jgi:hypothetical protein
MFLASACQSASGSNRRFVITKVSVLRLKRLHEASIELGGSVVLAGPNNFGKTTALQALAIWNLACRRWLEVRGRQSSKAKERTGVSITRPDYTPRGGGRPPPHRPPGGGLPLLGAR